MKIVVATVQDLFVHGGAGRLADGLVEALAASGHQVERVSLPFRWQPKREVLRQAYQWSLLDLADTGTDLAICLKFPAFYLRAPRKVAWILHQHRPLYDCFGLSDYSPFSATSAEDLAIQDAVRHWDTRYLGEMEQRFTISRTVSDRLLHHNRLVARPLYHPPPRAGGLRPGPFGDYVLYIGRMEMNKRPWLLVDALARARTPVRAILAGSGPQEGRVRDRARALGVEDRVEFRGAVTDQEREGLYASALAVFYAPWDEDLGYVTLEAFLAAKPVITMCDAGGPTEFVTSALNGVVAADVAEAAQAMDAYFEDRRKAEAHGLAGLATYREKVNDWETVCRELVAGC